MNRAVTDMNAVIRNIAATAEESASAAEEMNAQAQSSMQNVRDLKARRIGVKAHRGQFFNIDKFSIRSIIFFNFLSFSILSVNLFLV